jgi:iron(III) transport system permease protein
MLGLKTAAPGLPAVGFAPRMGHVVMALILGVLGFYILYPIVLIFINSFNVADLASDPPRYSLDNWRAAYREPLIFDAVQNTFLIYILYTAVSFPVAVVIAWVLARTNVPGAHWLEFGFWVSYLLPSLATTMGWILLLHPQIGLLNDAAFRLGLAREPIFNIYSVPGIVWAHLVGNAISIKVMLLTPAFRNMDLAYEEAARVSGASKLSTFLRVTIPLMTPALVIVFMLNLVRLFQSFETEQLLGTPFDFFVYSTLIYRLIRFTEPAQYGHATALASITVVLIALIIPLQRWLTQRKHFITVGARLKTGLIDLGMAKWPVFGAVVFVVLLLTVVPVLMLVLGTFMTRAGFWEVTPVFTLGNWSRLFSDNLFWIGLQTTLLLASASAIASPLIFSALAYILVRTSWKGRAALDALIWSSAALPGILSGLGLLWMFLGTPFLQPLYGTIVPLVIVVMLSGKLLGVQLSKAVFLQMGAELEESARVSGAGWLRTYFRVWLPLMMPTLALLATINFVGAASAASSVILLATKSTMTLSILALSFGTEGDLEVASAISLVVVLLTLGVALVARWFGLKVGLRHQ